MDMKMTDLVYQLQLVRVYDKQFSATEVADNFNNTKSRFGL